MFHGATSECILFAIVCLSVRLYEYLWRKQYGYRCAHDFMSFRQFIFLDPFCFVCVEVLRPSQPNGVMSSAVSLPNHTFTGQA